MLLLLMRMRDLSFPRFASVLTVQQGDGQVEAEQQTATAGGATRA